MSKEAKLQERLNNPSLEVLSGSRLYGTARKDSDFDTIGFIVPPKEYILGLNGFEQQILTDPDKKIYSITKFIQLGLKGNTTILETLFASEFAIIHCDDFGKRLRDNKELFVSKLLYSVFKGFSISEYRKVRAVGLQVEKPTKTELSALDWIWENCGPYNDDEKDAMRKLVFKNKKMTEVPITRNLGEKRKKDVEKYGYSTSNAGNMYRIMTEGCELLKTGKLTLPLPQGIRDTVTSIRKGEKTLEEIDILYQDNLMLLDIAKDGSNLPEHPDYEKASELLISIIEACHYGGSNIIENSKRRLIRGIEKKSSL